MGDKRLASYQLGPAAAPLASVEETRTKTSNLLNVLTLNRKS